MVPAGEPVACGIVEAPGRPEGFDVCGAGTDHSTVIVPFMFGWTSQVNV